MRKTAVLGLVIVMSLALGGCSMSNSEPGEMRSEGRVAQQINALPDVSGATVGYEQTTDGWSKHYAIAVEVTAPDAGASEARMSQLIDRILPLAWSVQGEEPDRGIVLRIKTEPQLAIGPIASASGWEDVGYPKNPKLLAKLSSQASSGKRMLDGLTGPWPVDADG